MKLLALFLSLCAWPVLAQTSGIQGTVRDSSGAVIVGAQITVTNIDTGIAIKAQSNDQGLYVVPLLNAGRYSIECSASGFAPKTLSELKLEVGQIARLVFDLSPGSVAESIQVSASAVLLNTETTDVGQVIDSKRILEMPLNGRNYLQLAQFTVGVLPGGMAAGSRARGEGAFAAVGMQIAQNNVLLDGNDNSSRTSGGPLGFEAQAVKPPVDAVAEFKVVTNNMSAEYGYRAGAKVLVTTMSGGNEFHGSAYEFLRNERLDGTNFFANRAGAKKPTYRQNQFGGTFGGPVLIPKLYNGKNRTFFFFSYQGTRIRTGRSFVSSVPSRDIVTNFDFSQQPAVRRNIFDPATLSGTGATAARLPFPGNRIPASRIDPVSKRVIDLYPVSNIAGRDNLPDNYFYSPSDSDDAEQIDTRVDHNFTERHRWFARYSRRDQFRYENGPLPFPATGGLGQTVDLKGNNVASTLSSTLTSSLFNEFRFGYSGFDTAFDIPFTENLNTQLGIRNAPFETIEGAPKRGWTRFTPTGFSEIGARSFWPNVNNLANFMFTDSLLWQKGRHAIKIGGEYRMLNVFRNASRFLRGQWAFAGQFTSQQPNNGTSRGNSGNGLADMALGWISGGSYGNNQGENINSPYYGFFVQDDWKISSKLTVNFGIRYETFFKGTFPDASRQSIGRYLLPEINGAEGIVFPKGSSDCGCQNDLNNWAPRLGIAWNVTPKTVIRVGGGVFYGEPNSISTENANFRSGPPRSTEIALQTNFETTPFFVQQGFPAFAITDTLQRNVDVNVFPQRRSNLYAGQWFFDIQRQLPFDTLLTVGYNGTKGTNLHVIRNVNQPLTPSATVQSNQRLIRPQFAAVNLHENSMNSSYQSLTVKAEKRFTRGFTFLNSFTWSHNIDYNNEDLLDGGQGAVTPYNLRLERGNSTLDRRLAYVASGVWEIPIGKGRKYLTSGPAEWILGGWQIGGLLSFYSGLPVPHTINVNNQNLGGSVRGDWVRNPNLPSSDRTIDRWFDTGFVVPSAPGVVSNAGRNLIYGPGRRNLDVTVARTFRLPFEGHLLQFRFESFNFTNTPNFGPPAAGVGTPTAGRITTAEDPRRIQFALKYNF